MRSTDLTRAISPFAALLLAVCSIVDAFSPSEFAILLAGLAFLAYAFLEFSRLGTAARALLLITACVYIVVWVFAGLDGETLVSAARRAAFLAFFLLAANSLRQASQTSRTIRDSGKIIVRQAPGWRYLWLSIGGGLLGVVVSMGAIPLLANMVRKSVDEDPEETRTQIREIRKRRMALAASRGFTTISMWSPTSIVVALSVAIIPDLRWIDILPMGLVLATSMTLIGWGLDRFSHKPQRVQTVRASQDYSPLFRLGLLIVMIPVIAAGLASMFGVSSIMGLLLTFPVFAVVWIFFQNLSRGIIAAIGEAAGRAKTEMLPALSDARNEAVIFACSGFLTVAILSLIDYQELSAFVQNVGLEGHWVLIGASVSMILLTLVGVPPIIPCTVLLEALWRIAGGEISALHIATCVSFTWAVALCIGPMIATIRMLGSILETPATTIALVWNRSFAVLCLLSYYAFLIVAV